MSTKRINLGTSVAYKFFNSRATFVWDFIRDSTRAMSPYNSEIENLVWDRVWFKIYWPVYNFTGMRICSAFHLKVKNAIFW